MINRSEERVLLWLLKSVHACAALSVATASSFALRFFLLLPFWQGAIIGLLTYVVVVLVVPAVDLESSEIEPECKHLRLLSSDTDSHKIDASLSYVQEFPSGEKSKMRKNLYKTSHLTLALVVLTSGILLGTCVADAQEPTSSSNSKSEITDATRTKVNKSQAAVAMNASFVDYKGIRIGMDVDQVRRSLDHLKEKGERQDFFVFSDQESAAIFYDQDGKVTAVSVDYIGQNSNAPSPQAVLGEDIPARPDGSMYKLKRYPEAGYWVAYNRTAGEHPVITVTMQKLM